jgi:tripartite ATP-independent transporter DctM subunit
MVTVLLVLILVLTLAGIPIGFSLIGAALIVILFETTTSPLIVPLRLFHGAESFPLVAVPLFILAGALMNRTGISVRLVDFAGSLIGWIRGGLAMTTTLTSMFFSEISGSAVADAAALGSVLVPAMKEKGYPAAFAAAVLSSAASIAIIIPPSVPMILYGSITETSIAKLFLAGVIPGILLGLAIMTASALLARAGGFAEREPFRLARVGSTLRRALLALSIPAVILGGIFTGVFTATEAAGLAVALALLAGAVGARRLGRHELASCFLESVRQTGVVMLLVAASAVVGWYLTDQQVPVRLADWVTSQVSGSVATLLLMNGALLVAGMFLHSTAAIVLLVPIFMPLAREVGVDPVHFGIIISLNLAIGQQTPPVASVLMTSCSIARVPMGQVMRVNLWFILAMAMVLLLVTFVPALTLWLPTRMLGS